MRQGHLSRIESFRANRGFTFLELLVVSAILVIGAFTVSISATPSDQLLIAHDVDRLNALFRLAHSEAALRGRPLSWEADESGYAFFEGSAATNRALDGSLRRRDWPFAVESVEGPTVVFGLEPLLPPAQFRLVTNRGETVLLVDAFGTVTLVQ